MLEFILGGAGSGKTHRITEIIKEKADNGEKVIIIVPEQFSFETDKRLYKNLGAESFNNILSVSFTSLAKEIFEKYGSRSGEYAEDIHKYILMSQSIKELNDTKSLKFFSKQSKKISFVGDVLKTITEFRQCGIGSGELIDKIKDSDAEGSEKIYDISLIYHTYENKLSENNLKDSLTDVSEAAAIANINDFFEEYTVFIDEFESFTGDQYDMIDTIFSVAKDVYIALRLENIGNNEYGLFDSVEKTWKSFYHIANKYNLKISTCKLDEPLKYKSEDLKLLNKAVFRTGENKKIDCENIEISECRDLYEEADLVCSQINNLVRSGYRYNDIAVISRQLEEYSYIFEAASEKYNIPYYMDVKKTAFHTSIMQLIISVVNIICDKNPATESILTYIKTQLNDFSIKDISEIENYCFEWDIKGEQWFNPFEPSTDKSGKMNALRERIISPIAKLREKSRGNSCSELCRNIYEFLYETKVPLRLSELTERLNSAGLIYEAKEQKRIWDMLMSILDAFSEVGDMMTSEEFRELFSLAVRQIKYSSPPQTLDCVRIVHAETARLDSPKVVFIVGANEGCFPMSTHIGGLLNEKNRIKLEMSGIHLSRSIDDFISDEKLITYKALTYASEKLYISYPLSDNTGGSRYPASLLNRIKKMFKNNILSYASEKDIIFYCSTPQAAYNNYVKTFRNNNIETDGIEKALSKDSYYSSRIDYLREVAEYRDFNIRDKKLVKKMYSESLNISATGIEEFSICNFKFFCNRGLKLKAKRKRQIGSLEQGNLVHLCLESVLKKCSTKEEFDNLSGNQIKNIISENINLYFEENMGGSLKKDARMINGIEEIEKSILEIINHLQNELKQSEFRPVEFEFNINEKGLPFLETSEGIQIILRGFIDRIDVYDNGKEKYIRVVDYKTGVKKFSLSSLVYGINMQMLLYLFSITDKNGKYNDYIPSGVLYMPSGEISCGIERESGESLEEYINQQCKMNGVVLEDRCVLNAMEKDIQGIYIPAKLKKEDDGQGELILNKRVSSCLTSKQFCKLRSYTESLISKICEEIYNGKISVNPLVLSGKSPCDYCDYWSVCGNIPCEKFRSGNQIMEEEFLDYIGNNKD